MRSGAASDARKRWQPMGEELQQMLIGGKNGFADKVVFARGIPNPADFV